MAGTDQPETLLPAVGDILSEPVPINTDTLYVVTIGSRVSPDQLSPPGVIPDDLLHYLSKVVVMAERVDTVTDKATGETNDWAQIDLNKLGQAVRAKAKHPSPRSEAGAFIEGIGIGMKKAVRYYSATVDVRIGAGVTVEASSRNDSLPSSVTPHKSQIKRGQR